MRDDAVPVVSLHRSGGGSLVLGNGAGPITRLNGMQGFGVAPVGFSTAPVLAGHGSVLRGRRLEERELFVPIMMEAETMSGLDEIRDGLTRLLSPLDDRELTLRVSVPGRGRWREIPVHYSRGLQGDYGTSYFGTWEKLGLEFKATEALWRGEPVQVSRQVAPGVKPFLSQTEPFFPVILAGSTIAGRIDIDVQGDAPTAPVWTITPPGEDLSIRHVGTGARFYLDGLLTETIHLDMGSGRLWSASSPDGGLWDRVSVDTRLFELTPGRNQVDVVFVGATPDSMVHVHYSPRYLAGY